MLAFLRLRSVRHALVIMLVILSAMVVVERTRAVIDSVQHGLAIDHAASMLDLAIADHDHHDDHDQGADDGLSDVGGKDRAPDPHHHHSEGPQIAALISPVTMDVAVSAAADLFMRADTGSPQSRIFGLERPPKALSEPA